MATRYIIQEDGVAHILLEDGTNALIKDGVAQASDDVLIRLGPKISDTAHSGLVAPSFTAGTAPPSTVFGGHYYLQNMEWFAST